MTRGVGPLGTLPNAPRPSTDPARDAHIRTAAQRFEGVLIQQLVQVMRTTTPEMFSGSGGDMYGAMFDEAMGESLTRQGGIGLAEVIARSMGAGPRPAANTPGVPGAPGGAGLGPDVSTSLPVRPLVPRAFGTRAPDLGPSVENRPASGAGLPGATGALQHAAASMLPGSGVAPQWGREGTLSPSDLASDFHTVEAGGEAHFRVRDIQGYQGYYKCNLFAMELARRAGFQVPVAGGQHGWGYVGPDYVVRDAEDGEIRGDWATVATDASASALDSAIVRGDRAFMIAGSSDNGHRGHMGIVERVHEIERDADGQVTRVVFDGWESRPHGAMHLTQRVWAVSGHPGGPGSRGGLGRIEILELQRPQGGERPEQPLHGHAGASIVDGR